MSAPIAGDANADVRADIGSICNSPCLSRIKYGQTSMPVRSHQTVSRYVENFRICFDDTIRRAGIEAIFRCVVASLYRSRRDRSLAGRYYRDGCVATHQRRQPVRHAANTLCERQDDACGLRSVVE